ncbi:MAG: enoyl-CoA hydratase/isomerase family protein [bacterium]|nr:enoyl-CoA hydratase/isomerase family protein [bacterium]
MKDQHLRIVRADGFVRVQMTHGVNAFDLGLISALTNTMTSLAENNAPAVLLSSEHARLFSPGWDLKTLHQAPEEDAARVLEGFEGLILRMFSYPGPTVVAVGGHAVAGGCLLALACDRRVMASGRARIGLSEVNLGVPVPAGCVEMLRARLSPEATERLLLSGEGFSAEGAAQLGIVQQAVDSALLSEVAERELRTLASKPQAAYRAAKQFLHQRTWSEMLSVAANGADQFLTQWRSAETQKRLSELVESLTH